MRVAVMANVTCTICYQFLGVGTLVARGPWGPFELERAGPPRKLEDRASLADRINGAESIYCKALVSFVIFFCKLGPPRFLPRLV